MNTFINPFRNLVLGADTKVPIINNNYRTYINFDNAATTPPFVDVIKQINNYSLFYSSIHRGTGYKSQLSSYIYEKGREIVLHFLGANTKSHQVIFVKNTTEGINKLACRIKHNENKHIVLSTDMEHHSNDLPWRNKYEVHYIAVNDKGRLSLEDYKNKLEKYKDQIRLVTVTGASNVTGFINPIYEMAELAHKYGAEILVDGAQLVPHKKIKLINSFSPLKNIDYLVFSAHKMYAPFGTGVLITPHNSLSDSCPEYQGGGTVDMVTHNYIRWKDGPEKEEAGTPNVLGVMALIASIEVYNKINIKNIDFYEKQLTKYALKKLLNIDDIIIYGDCYTNKKLGIIPFNIKDVPHQTTAKILSDYSAIAVRSGCFCAQPYAQKLLRIDSTEVKKRIEDPNYPHPGMVRVSFGIYNTFKEIDDFVFFLNKFVKNKKIFS